MVLGYLLYEAVDILYNVARIGYEGVSKVYDWYKGEDSARPLEESELEKLKARMAVLEDVLTSARNTHTKLEKAGTKTPCQPQVPIVLTSQQ